MLKVSENEHSVWYREPWFWLLMSPLILVVMVSAVLVSVALSGSDDVVSDHYYKEGRMLSQEFTAEEYAQSIGLSGNITIDQTSSEVIVTLNQAIDDRELSVYLSHPVKADLDQRFQVKKNHGAIYRADLPAALSGRWYIRVTAMEAGGDKDINAELKGQENFPREVWRLVGEIDFQLQSQVALQ